ncbi:MAG: amidohydrolase family protein [Streptosporangiaceae bacterium]|jgi:predicted TIM-barrel fold metal-dependent hydrolase|nr:amidohydrolase family protein [Streptosporangiaceae bacterium]
MAGGPAARSHGECGTVHPVPESPLTDAEVPAFWQALGLPGLIDIHVHFMPPRLMLRVWEYFDAAGPLLGREWPIHYRSSQEERVAKLRELGVRVFTALAYPHKTGMAESLNQWTAEFAKDVPECLSTGTFFPEPNVAAYVRRAIDGGTRLFKVHLQVGGFDPREEVLDPVWGMLAEAGTPALVHAGSGPVANGFTGPGPFGEVMQRHPDLSVIVAHMGMPEFDGFFSLAERYDRVHLDTTGVFTDFSGGREAFPAELVPRLRDLGLAGRILLGTDFPNISYEYAHQLEALAGLGLGDEWLREVCWQGAARLLSL